MTFIVGFGHKARHGKDTAGEAVVNYYEQQRRMLGKVYGVKDWRNECPVPRAKLYKFADALYEVCRSKYGMTTKDPLLLQKVGMEGREIDKNYWVNLALTKIAADNPDIAVITDVRFHNEAECIKDKGGVRILVARLNADGTPYVAGDRPADHISETALDGYNFDHRIVVSEGHAVLTEQLAITIVEYERAMRAIR